jgi:hypothetical protein
MNALPKSLPIMPRLHQSERDMPPISMTEISTATDENIVRLTALATPEDEALDAFDSIRGIQINRRDKFKYRPMQGSRTDVQDTSDPFAESLD